MESRRGSCGGYTLAVTPEELTALDVIEVLIREIGSASQRWPSDAVSGVWEEAEAALADVLVGHSLARLAEEEGHRWRTTRQIGG